MNLLLFHSPDDIPEEIKQAPLVLTEDCVAAGCAEDLL